jgi:hypothetical protein
MDEFTQSPWVKSHTLARYREDFFSYLPWNIVVKSGNYPCVGLNETSQIASRSCACLFLYSRSAAMASPMLITIGRIYIFCVRRGPLIFYYLKKQWWCSFHKKLLLISIWPLYVNKLPMLVRDQCILTLINLLMRRRISTHHVSTIGVYRHVRGMDAKSNCSELKSCLNNQLKRAGFLLRF